MDSANRRLSELERMMRDFREVLRARAAARSRHLLNIPRVFSMFDDDTGTDDAPDAFVTARLRPRHPLGGSAIALPEPDEDAVAEAVGRRR